jgi:hypothetical protein
MLYNHELSPREVDLKVEQCFQWGVQVADCRFRPLNMLDDGYDPRRKRQSDTEYYLHPGWTDVEVRGLRRTVRSNNICVRYGIPRERYDQVLESLSHGDRMSIAESLGFQGDRLSDEQLESINQAWRATRLLPAGS